MDGGRDGTKPRLAAEEEIRFAVVLNGGVSLAVWMGGVVLELDRLTRGRRGYNVLLDFMRSRARADVISGTSAGGINGAALALSQVNDAADLSVLRDVWADQGRLESLLRQPFRGSPPSLLRGDEYFLPQLGEALGRLAKPFKDPQHERPIDLTITTTLLRGARTMTVDALGQRLPQLQHDGRFWFRRDPKDAPPRGEKWRDDFPADDAKRNETITRLALAARCTAGFPVAFEPSFVPVDGPAVVGDAALAGTDYSRPDMGQVASWREVRPAGERPTDRSRFAVDGGVLVNTPTKAALEAVDRMPAADPVHRVMLIVFPHAPSPDAREQPDVLAEMPTVTSSARRILAALSSQGSRTFVNEIDTHNRFAAGRRGGRFDVLNSLRSGPDGLAGPLYDLAGRLLPHYRSLRVRRAARDLAGRVPPQATWSYDRTRRAAELAQQSWLMKRKGKGLPYVPDVAPPSVGAIGPHGWLWGITAADGLATAALDLLKRLIWVVPAGAGAEVETMRARRSELHKARADLRELRDRTDRPWTEDPALAAIEPNETYWSIRLAVYQALYRGDKTTFDTAVEDQPANARAALEGLVEANSQIGGKIRGLVLEVAKIVANSVPLLENLDPTQRDLGGLKPWHELLVSRRLDNEPGDRHLTVLHRLLALEIAVTCLADESPTGSEQPIDLVQISLQTDNPFAVFSRSADDKVGGWALGRFSGFLKQSWRINDWTWGRIDGATMLCKVLLDPQRIRRICVLERWLGDSPAEPSKVAGQVAAMRVRALVKDLFGVDVGEPGWTGFGDARLAKAAEQATADLAIAIDPSKPTGDLPPMLEGLAKLAAWGLHVQLIRDELPALARAIKADGVEGANLRSRGQLFLKAHESLLERLEPGVAPGPSSPAPDGTAELRLGVEALEAFDRAGIGREDLAEEGTSDQLIRTAATAAGVAVTVADGGSSGLSAVKPVTRTLRGLVLLPYWTISGLTRSGVIVRFLVLLAFALGATLVTLALFGALPAWAAGPAAAFGGGALLAAFAYSALRTGTFLHGLALLSPVIPLIVYAATATDDRAEASATTAVSVVTIVLLLAGGLIVLGSLPSPVRSPVALLADGLDRWADKLRLPGPRLSQINSGHGWKARGRAAAAAAIGFVLAVMVGFLVWGMLVTALPWILERSMDAAAWLADRPFLTALVLAAIVAAASFAAFGSGRTLQKWRLSPDGTKYSLQRVDDPAATTAGWSVVYGASYLVIALVTVWRVPDDTLQSWWARSVVITALAFAGVLLAVVPWLAPMARRRKIVRQLVGPDTRWSLPTADPVRELTCQLLKAIVRHDVTYRFLVRPGPNGCDQFAAAPTAPDDQARQLPQVSELQLTSSGERDLSRLHRRLVSEERARQAASTP